MSNWQIRISMWDCDRLSDREFSVVEEQIPFIPRKKEAFFMSERCKNECELYAKECWNIRKCEDCPYIYRGKKSVEDISVDDVFIVDHIIYNVDEKIVTIAIVKPHGNDD